MVQTRSSKTGKAFMQEWLSTNSKSQSTQTAKKRKIEEADSSLTTANKKPKKGSNKKIPLTVPARRNAIEKAKGKHLEANKNTNLDEGSNLSTSGTASPVISPTQATMGGPSPCTSYGTVPVKTKSHPRKRTLEDSDSDVTEDHAPDTPETKTLTVNEMIGDIFDAPDNSVIIHACNCCGRWGAGIAVAFKTYYPSAFARHHAHCKKLGPEAIIKTAQLISPSDSDQKQHWVGCLFTSRNSGRYKDTVPQILSATGPAMRDLLRQIAEAKQAGHEVGEVRICQINAGLFQVPWARTKAVLESIEVSEDMPDVITVYNRP